ncbi:GON-4-like protein isoform X3 [Daktulosphaira vitifoliae]|nr:GON-4-like protein isoform X3 [Daktulosphaira vitifoliae]
MDSSVDIDKILADKAKKNRLTKKNVKNLIKNVLTNDDVATMLRQTLDDEGNDANCLYEPKLTRAKIREMLKSYPPSVHQWSPFQQQSIISECRLLIEQEFPDDSEDEEYKPDKILEEDDDEEDDDESKCTEVNKSFDVESDIGNDSYENSLISNKETIGMRTRSKFSLSDTPLEIIEQAFIPPDITEDMYDFTCENDEWMQFLSEFTKPLDSAQNEDTEDDPEYNVLCDDDFTSIDKEEFRIDKSVKITRKEYNDLMNELYEFTESYIDYNDASSNKAITKNDCEKDLNKSKNLVLPVTVSTPNNTDLKWEMTCSIPNNFQFIEPIIFNEITQLNERKITKPAKKNSYNLSVITLPSPQISNIQSINTIDNMNQVKNKNCNMSSANHCKLFGILPKQIIVLKHQLAQHVQLITQQYALCTLEKSFTKHLRVFSKMINTLKDITKGKCYTPNNMYSSIRFINDWRTMIKDDNELKNYSSRGIIPFEMMRFMLFYYEPLFIFPELLPSKLFSIKRNQLSITPSEEMFLLMKIDYMYKQLKEDVRYRAKFRHKELQDMLPLILKTVQKRWFSHRRLTDLKIHITRYKNTLTENRINVYLKTGQIEKVVHYVNMEALNSTKCLFELDIKIFPSIWKPTLKQLTSIK